MHPLFITVTLSTFTSVLSASLMERLTRPINMMGSFVQFRLTHNPGIAFSIALPSSIQTALIIIALIFVCFAAYRSTNHGRLTMVAYGLIIGGALGNVIDRLPDGLVTDFIAIGTFPIFNVADVYICIGAGLLMLEGMSVRKNAPIECHNHRPPQCRQ